MLPLVSFFPLKAAADYKTFFFCYDAHSDNLANKWKCFHDKNEKFVVGKYRDRSLATTINFFYGKQKIETDF